MSKLPVPGAELYYERHGAGPLVVLVPGASGVAESFRPLAQHLATRFTVLLYDRRGFSRSRLDAPPDEGRLRRDADDVRDLIDHLDVGPAEILGASSGAVVALAAIEQHPDAVRRVVAFEPPLVRLLADGQRWLDRFNELYDHYRDHGPEATLTRFREAAFPPTDQAVMAKAPVNDANAVHWFEHELRRYPATDPDLSRLSELADRIVPAVGRDGPGYPCHDATIALAGRLDQPVATFTGGHVSFVSHATDFAGELTAVLAPREAA